MKNKVIVFVLLALALTAQLVGAAAPGTNVDPFGGLPVFDALGNIAPGGVPSVLSGSGASPRAAIYLGGQWDAQGNELANCATLRFIAGKSVWFKLDTWSDRRTQIWLDDELASATAPSGSAVWGAANKYMQGTAPGDAWRINAYPRADAADPNFVNGYALAVYDPDSIKPLNTFAPPNAAILSVNVDARGFLLNGPTNIAIADAAGARIHGFASYNKMQPSHMLWYEAQFGGWVFAQVYNQMIWDDTASVCARRVLIL